MWIHVLDTFLSNHHMSSRSLFYSTLFNFENSTSWWAFPFTPTFTYHQASLYKFDEYNKLYSSCWPAGSSKWQQGADLSPRFSSDLSIWSSTSLLTSQNLWAYRNSLLIAADSDLAEDSVGIWSFFNQSLHVILMVLWFSNWKTRFLNLWFLARK